MAYLNDFVKLSWGGSVYGGEDIWTNGMHLGNVFTDTSIDMESPEAAAYILGIANLLSAWFTQEYAGFSNQVTLEWVKLANIGKDGKYINDPLVYDYSTPFAGEINTYVAPQLSLALSTTTPVRRGPGKDGRIFAPMPAAPMNASGRITLASQYASAFATLLRGINGLTSPLPEQDVYLVNVSPSGSGAVAPITGVRVGDVLDTQRRRRNKFIENYTAVKLSP